MSDYKPGLYAVDSWRGKGQMAFRAVRGDVASWCVFDGDDTRGLDDDEVTDVRPLVTLDLGDSPFPERVAGWLRNGGWLDLADQIEAQTRPPKPEEPTGRYAVVEDSQAREWVAIDGVSSLFRWQLLGQPQAASEYATWDEIDAVKVVRS